MQMTKVAIWCRHEADNLIGIGDDIPWHIPSDSRFFADVIAGQDVVFGRKTYETVPPEVLSDCAVWVLSKNQNYEPRNPDTERLVGDVRAFKEFEGGFVYRRRCRGLFAVYGRGAETSAGYYC